MVGGLEIQAFSADNSSTHKRSQIIFIFEPRRLGRPLFRTHLHFQTINHKVLDDLLQPVFNEVCLAWEPREYDHFRLRSEEPVLGVGLRDHEIHDLPKLAEYRSLLEARNIHSTLISIIMQGRMEGYVSKSVIIIESAWPGTGRCCLVILDKVVEDQFLSSGWRDGNMVKLERRKLDKRLTILQYSLRPAPNKPGFYNISKFIPQNRDSL